MIMTRENGENIQVSKFSAVDFERPIEEINEKIEELRLVEHGSELDLADEIKKLELNSRQLTKDIFSKLSASAMVSSLSEGSSIFCSEFLSRAKGVRKS